MGQAGPAMRRGVVVGAGHDADMTNPVGPEAQGRYRCPDRGGPGGQRCQLLIEHATPAHIASIGGTFRAWVDSAETALPPRPYPWFVSFPQDESRRQAGMVVALDARSLASGRRPLRRPADARAHRATKVLTR
jgi:hypothetical protein